MNNVKSRVERITPELAREYLKANQNNRPLNEKTVDYYAMQMQAGQWRMNGEAICFEEGGLLVNSQHRLQAIIKSGIPIDMLVVRGCEKGSFVTYDSGRNRTIKDVFALSEIPNYSAVSSVINRYISFKSESTSLRKDRQGLSSITARKISKADMLDIYNQNADLFQEAALFAKQCSKKIALMKVSEIGGLWAYLVLDKNHPKEFVSKFFRILFLGEETHLKVIGILRDKIIQSKLVKTSMNPKYKESILKKAWNCYVMNKDLRVLSYNEKEGNLYYY